MVLSDDEKFKRLSKRTVKQLRGHIKNIKSEKMLKFKDYTKWKKDKLVDFILKRPVMFKIVHKGLETNLEKTPAKKPQTKKAPTKKGPVQKAPVKKTQVDKEIKKLEKELNNVDLDDDEIDDIEEEIKELKKKQEKPKIKMTTFDKPEKPKKKSSSWIEHVKAYQKQNNVSYKQAMKDSKASYSKK